jgi:hypothetical protein
MGGNRKLNKQMRKMMKDGDMDLDPSSFGMWFSKTMLTTLR